MSPARERTFDGHNRLEWANKTAKSTETWVERVTTAMVNETRATRYYNDSWTDKKSKTKMALRSVGASTTMMMVAVLLAATAAAPQAQVSFTFFLYIENNMMFVY